MSTLRVAAVQHDVMWEEAAATCAHLEGLVARAAAGGARLTLLTEMFATGFTMNAEGLSEDPEGPSTQWLRDQATRHDMWIGGSIPTRHDGGRPLNVFTLVSPGGEVHRYAKLHPFSYGGESKRYGSGAQRVSVTIEGVRCALFVCYDIRFANAFWDLAPSTDAYLVVANWPEGRREHWMSLLHARAIENQAYVVGVNRVGSGGGLDYSGDSRIIDPFGIELATARGSETVLFADLDTEVVTAIRGRYPFLADRRDF
jgi:predicted amidohydrolase